MSDNTTSVIDSGSDNSCVASGNSNSSNVNSCKNDKNIAIDNASSSYGNNIVVSFVILPVVQFLMIMFPPTLMTTWMRVTLMTIWVTLKMPTTVPLPGTMLLL